MLTLTSPAFAHKGAIPAQYTCDGDRFLSPPLEIEGVPETAKSLALIVDDPDVPKLIKPDGMFDHWIVYNLNPMMRSLKEGEALQFVGRNSMGDTRYTGPCPPLEYEPPLHHYYFKLYALDTVLEFENPPGKTETEEAMEGHIIEQTALVGLYHKQNKTR